jgi:hypothetical protein
MRPDQFTMRSAYADEPPAGCASDRADALALVD